MVHLQQEGANQQRPRGLASVPKQQAWTDTILSAGGPTMQRWVICEHTVTPGI